MKLKSIPAAQRRKILIYYGLALLLPALFTLIVFIKKEIAPFGTYSVLTLDLWGQYFPMYVQHATGGLGSLFHSWNGAFGYNNWAQNAYYCSSLFIWLLHLLPVRAMATAVDIFCLVKIMLSGGAFLGYLHYRTKTLHPAFIAGAVGYALCSYTVAFISQFMWTDCMFLFPFILIGIERILEKNRPFVYVLALGMTIIVNFYIGFSICIFCALYFLSRSVACFAIERSVDHKLHLRQTDSYLRKLLIFGGGSLLAGALSAVVIIPIYYALSHTLASGLAAPEGLEWYQNFTGVFQDMLNDRPVNVGYRGENIATGILAFLTIPLYFANHHIRIGQRIADGVLLLFLTLSLNCNLLDYLWHGLHFTNQLPMRWSFIFCLFTLSLSCMGLCKMQGISLTSATAGSVLGLLGAWITSRGLGETESYTVGVRSWVLLVLGACCILASALIPFLLEKDETDPQEEKNKKVGDRKPQKIGFFSDPHRITAACVLVLSVLMTMDSGLNFLSVCFREENGLRIAEEKNYSLTVEKHVNVGQQLMDIGGDTDFYRTETFPRFTFDPSMFGGNHGMTYYSSTMNGNTYHLLRSLGNRVYAENVSTIYTPFSPVQNSLFGLRYIEDFDNVYDSYIGIPYNGTEDNYGTRWENPTALPLAYAVDDGAMGYTVTKEVRALRNQNELLNALVGESLDVFEKLETTEFSYENLTLQPSEDWDSNFYVRTDTTKPLSLHYTYTAPKTGALYAEHNYRVGDLIVKTASTEKKYSSTDGMFFCLGYFEAGETVEIDITVDNINLGCCGLDAYYLNEDKWAQAVEKLRAHSLNITQASDTQISGTVDLDQDRLFLVSAEQDGGWQVKCDGQRLEPQTIADTLLAVRLPAGQHRVVLTYHVPGLTAGIVISGAAWILLIGAFLLWRRKNASQAEEGEKSERIEESAEDEESEKDEKSAEDEGAGADGEAVHEDETAQEEASENAGSEPENIKEAAEKPEKAQNGQKRSAKKKNRKKRS